MRTRSAAVAVLVSAPGGGTQLITVVAPTPSSPPSRRSNQVTVLDVASRKQGTQTTPSGLYGLPYAFGIKAAPSGTSYKYRAVKRRSWSFQDNASRSRNRWVEPRPRTAGPRNRRTSSPARRSTRTRSSSGSTTTGPCASGEPGSSCMSTGGGTYGDHPLLRSSRRSSPTTAIYLSLSVSGDIMSPYGEGIWDTRAARC
jgi:hypothetical protein